MLRNAPEKAKPKQSVSMHIKDFLASLHANTASEYKTTLRYLDLWQSELEQYPTFADYLAGCELSEATKHKHLRQASTLCKRCNLDYPLGTLPTKTPKSPPLKFTDSNFQSLCTAFADCDYPRFIIAGERHRFWLAVIHFAAVTALRREAILGLKLSDINFAEFFVTVPAAVDKKDTERYKPLTPELAAELVELRRFYDLSQIQPARQPLLFPWIHGDKKWYQCWNSAESKVGKRFRLHDLKRFSGELALRVGATPLELQQHMDPADFRTRLTHYCRPVTTALVHKFKVPLPGTKHHRTTPLFTEPELKSIIESGIIRRLVEAGVDAATIKFVLDDYGNVDFGDSLSNDRGVRQSSASEKRPTDSRTVKKGGKSAKDTQTFRVFWGDEQEGGAV